MAPKIFNTGKFSEKVLALSNYDSVILQSLYQNPINQQKITRGAAFFIKNYFDQYIDARARQDPASYHHIYEFDKTGNPSARLFKAVIGNTFDGSAVINYSFTSAKEPNREGYPFPNKAEIMESGQTITITPKRSKYLKYQLEDGRFVTSEKSVVTSPGGLQVKGSFESTFRSFMASQGKVILEKFGYYKKVEQAMISKRRLAIPRINSGMTADAINRARMDAKNVADGVVSYYA